MADSTNNEKHTTLVFCYCAMANASHNVLLPAHISHYCLAKISAVYSQTRQRSETIYTAMCGLIIALFRCTQVYIIHQVVKVTHGLF